MRTHPLTKRGAGMKRWFNRMTAVILAVLAFLTVGGLSAEWIYPSYPADTVADRTATAGSFKYGLIYITEINVTGGSYVAAELTKNADTEMSADLELGGGSSPSITVDVVFYNSTSVSYYYDTTEKVSYDNEGIVYSVSGISQKDEVPSGTYKTVTLTFAYDGSVSSETDLLCELNFKFTVDKDSIGGLVAETAVDRFADILNNIVSDNSYSTLEEAMNNRDGINKGSAVTYIGNVVGADSSDSATIVELFSREFMKADLDGDGQEEPITMMIKRENLDNNLSTGASYTYSSWFSETTVQGVEMTLYITSEQIGSADIVVYAATFTRAAGATEWTQITPLIKGTAETNRYSGGWGAADSFNTDTWRSDDNKTIEQIVAENL